MRKYTQKVALVVSMLLTFIFTPSLRASNSHTAKCTPVAEEQKHTVQENNGTKKRIIVVSGVIAAIGIVLWWHANKTNSSSLNKVRAKRQGNTFNVRMFNTRILNASMLISESGDYSLNFDDNYSDGVPVSYNPEMQRLLFPFGCLPVHSIRGELNKKARLEFNKRIFAMVAYTLWREHKPDLPIIEGIILIIAQYGTIESIWE